VAWNELVTCDQCGTQFKLDLKVKPLKGGGEQHFFASGTQGRKCPNKRCRKRYVVANITPKGVELRHQIQQIRRKLTGVDEDQQEGLLIDLAVLQKQLEPEISK
jgi:hypothetical protein